MTGNPTGSMSVHDLQALLAQAMRSGRDPSQPVLNPRAMYGTTTYSNTPFQLGPHHPSHIPIRDTRPQPMMSYASQLALSRPSGESTKLLFKWIEVIFAPNMRTFPKPWRRGGSNYLTSSFIRVFRV
ncbi:hypothetical protein N7471_006550 [Penicillium samsonianum]|uniref:uncharacterized protein n=1 Tax=Penicillium samsonianum TaxID=1882272 RepID=UPI00254992B4|nr:uncharacterized protein N7471_006550 [Penicillium samsonianum]KAJ6140064.1 hypothetical protein N7471_006550 [Penicillium samsonianum]